MALINLEALDVTLGAPLFSNLNLAIGPGDRLGLVAANGCPTAAPGVPAPPASPPATECDLIGTMYYGLFSTSPTAPGAQAKVLLAASKLLEITAKVDDQLIDKDGDAEVEGLPRMRRALTNGDAASCNRTDPTAANACGMVQALQIIRGGIPQLVDTLLESAAAAQQDVLLADGWQPAGPQAN